MIANPSSAAAHLRQRLAALLACLAIALGAVGAHALEPALTAIPKGVETWKTAAFYHALHAVALYFLAASERARAYWCLFAGTLCFSGSLYAWLLTQWHPLVFVTPLGGVLLMLGWALLAFKGKA